jgi:peptidoglycan/LPS O-acetylase OafA/YrhL
VIEYVRYGLALLVAQTHLWSPFNDEHLGQQAVFAFYTLSGYLMTRVLNERYGFTPVGTLGFIVNRILRLWPGYLFVACITLVGLQYLPLGNFNSAFRVPSTTFDALMNLTIVGQVGFDHAWLQGRPFLALTSWSLSIELVSYLLLALYFARSPRRLMLLAVIGLAGITASSLACDGSAFYGPYCFQNRYGVLQAGFAPFALGGLLYFRGRPLSIPKTWIWRTAVLGVVVLVQVVCWKSQLIRGTVSTYVGCLLMAALILAIPKDRPTWVSDFFGRASYHLFIGHMTIAALLVAGGIVSSGWRSFLATILGCLTLSSLLVPLEHWINRLRNGIRLSIGHSAVPARDTHA